MIFYFLMLVDIYGTNQISFDDISGETKNQIFLSMIIVASAIMICVLAIFCAHCRKGNVSINETNELTILNIELSFDI